jgi:hypothetical protein
VNFTWHMSVCAHAVLVSPDAFVCLCQELSAAEQCDVLAMFVDIALSKVTRCAVALSLSLACLLYTPVFAPPWILTIPV